MSGQTSFLLFAVVGLLELFMWLILGRLVLRLLSGGKETFFTQLFRRGTEPVYYVVRRASFGLVSERLIPVVALLLLFLIRAPLVMLLRQGA